MFKLYTGNTQQFFIELFANNEEFLRMFNIYGLDHLELFCYELSKSLEEDAALWSDFSNTNQDMLSYYTAQKNKKRETHRRVFIDVIEGCLRVTGISTPCTDYGVEELYVSILSTLSHGSTRRFFRDNKEAFIPEYDLFLINKDESKTIFLDEVFGRFDKLSMIIDSLKNFVDIDEVPREYLIRLMEVIGLTVNDFNGALTEEKIRSLAKNIIEAYRHKGNKKAIEAVFNSIGIDVEIKELFFDRRKYYDSRESEADKFEFRNYLTEFNPCRISAEGTDEDVNDESLTYPISENVWNFILDSVAEGEEKEKVLKNLLGYLLDVDTSSVVCKNGSSYLELKNSVAGGLQFSYFKANFLSFQFRKFINGTPTEINDENEIRMCRYLVDKFCPIYIKRIYK